MFIPPHKPATPYVQDQTVNIVKLLWLIADCINGVPLYFSPVLQNNREEKIGG